MGWAIRGRAPLRSGLEDWLAEQVDAGLILDGVLARSLQVERRLWALREAVIYALIGAFGGSITAGHGIGRIKRQWGAACRDATAAALSRGLKSALDPKGLMNPGTVL